jgi:hypothetical protein
MIVPTGTDLTSSARHRSFFSGGGELGGMIRAFDWSSHAYLLIRSPTA